MPTKFSHSYLRQLAWMSICLFLLAASMRAQDEINLKGAIDFRVHSRPDSVERSIDADDVAILAKEAGMRALVLVDHGETTATLAYEVRKHVPGLEVFGGVVLNRPMGGINLANVEEMQAVTGHYGRVVWMPTSDSENYLKTLKQNRPTVPVVKDGHLLPEVIDVIDFIAKHPQMILATGHISGNEAAMIIHEAHARGVKHIVATNPTGIFPNMSVAQLKQAVADGAYLEFVYLAVIGNHPQRSLAEYAASIRAVGPEHVILGTDFGEPEPEMPHYRHPEALLRFMHALHDQGFTVAEINMMAKTNPASVLELKP